MKPEPRIPPTLIEHQFKYHTDAWKNYTLGELGQFVHLLHKRASHRKDATKRTKDLTDARNYWHMMGAWLHTAEQGDV